MQIDQNIEPGQLYREADTERSFKILSVRSELGQARVMYLDDVNRERLVDTRGRTDIKLIDAIKRKLAEGSLVRVSQGPNTNLQ